MGGSSLNLPFGLGGGDNDPAGAFPGPQTSDAAKKRADDARRRRGKNSATLLGQKDEEARGDVVRSLLGGAGIL